MPSLRTHLLFLTLDGAAPLALMEIRTLLGSALCFVLLLLKQASSPVFYLSRNFSVPLSWGCFYVTGQWCWKDRLVLVRLSGASDNAASHLSHLMGSGWQGGVCISGGLEAWSQQSRNNGSNKHSQMVVGQWRTTGSGLSCWASQSGMGKKAETWMFSRWERGRALCQGHRSWWKLFREGKSTHWPSRVSWLPWL